MNKWATGLLIILCAVSGMEEKSWDSPCISEPHAYVYQDSDRAIAINRIEVDESVGFIADVQLRSAGGFHVGMAEKGTDVLSTMVQGSGAVLAVNADNYRSHNYGVIIRDGQCIRKRDSSRHLLAINADGSFQMISSRRAEKAAALSERLLAEKARHTFEFGPVLVENGEAVAFPNNFRLIATRDTRREPRTAIGMIAPLHYVIVVVDGRQPGYSEGVSLQTMQQIFVELGVESAFNLDGGGTTELWFQGDIINRPAGGHERQMSDFIWY